MTDVDELLGRLVGGRYLIDRPLGAGGMGAVYVATQLALDRAVAIKCLRQPMASDALAKKRFEQEARSIARLSHPHIVEVFDFVDEGDRFFIVMELVEGRTLRSQLNREGALEPRRALQVIRQIAQALAEVHEIGLLHRDVKPDNVVVRAGTGDEPFIKLLDFGIAKLLGPDDDATQTDVGILSGTPGYLAPEVVLEGTSQDPRSDLYSLGVLAFELLVGKPPFAAATPIALVMQHASAPLPRFVDLAPDRTCPAGVEDLVHRLLSKQPEDRPASARALISEIDQLLTGLDGPQPTRVRVLPVVVPPPPHNLPAARTLLLGREAEVDEILSLLGRTRLLTLVGAGGAGKTRISLHVAHASIGSLVDGARLVELAPVAEAHDVLSAVAAALAVAEAPDRSLKSTIVSHIAEQRLLLLLDNCEHVIETVARIADDLISSCPRLIVLATSREALGVDGETAWRIPSLKLPRAPADGEDATGTLARIASSPAVRLFVERARAVQPAFELAADNASAVEQVCAQLDGIPLAIELAAARVTALTVTQVAARLDDRFRLLTGGNRTALPRQQTLRALTDWSYDLLSEPEQTLLRRLGVFAGGWTLELAEQVCADARATPTIGGEDVLELLSRLINKSLVEARVEGDRYRYRFLDTLRAYARDRLTQGAELSSVRDRHVDAMLQLAEEAARGMFGPEQPRWLARLESEHDNLRAALVWSLRDPTLAQRLAGALAWFWQARGHRQEGARWLVETCGLNDARSLERAIALRGLGFQSWSIGRAAQARHALDEAVDIFRSLGDDATRELALALTLFGSMLGFTREDDQLARALCEEGLALFRSIDDLWGIGRALGGLVDATLAAGDLDAARGYVDDGLATFLKTGNDEGIAYLSLRRAALDVDSGPVPQLAKDLLVALDAFTNMHSSAATAHAVAIVAQLAARIGEDGTASCLQARATLWLEELCVIRSPHEARATEQLRQVLLGRLGQAELEALEAEVDTWSTTRLVEDARELLARAADVAEGAG